MIRHIITFVLISMALCRANSQNLRTLWPSAPADVVPLLSVNNRLDMIDFIDNDMEARVRNALSGFSVLDTLSEDYLRCSLTTLSTLEMRMLPTTDTAKVVVVVNTALVPEAVSTLRLYDTEWRQLSIVQELPSLSAFVDSTGLSNAICVQAIREFADLPVVSMSVCGKQTLTLTLSLQNLSRESRQALAEHIHPVIMQWNNEKMVFTTDTDLR